jgi:hypothetical protein
LNSTASTSPPGFVVVIDVDVVTVDVVDVEEVEDVVVELDVVVLPLQAVNIKGTTKDSITREANHLFFILPSPFPHLV